jgi:UDP-glucose:tetrahydrobiopterin glucosyltransferase
LVEPGVNGLLVEPDDVAALALAAQAAVSLDRRGCREWVERQASRQAFATRLEAWLQGGLSLSRAIGSHPVA